MAPRKTKSEPWKPSELRSHLVRVVLVGAAVVAFVLAVGTVVLSSSWKATAEEADGIPQLTADGAEQVCEAAFTALAAGNLDVAISLEKRLRTTAAEDSALELSCVQRLSAAVAARSEANNPLLDLAADVKQLFEPLLPWMLLVGGLVLFGRILYMPAALAREVWQRGKVDPSGKGWKPRLLRWFRKRGFRSAMAALMIGSTLVFVPAGMQHWKDRVDSGGEVFLPTSGAVAGWLLLLFSIAWLVLATHARFPSIKIEEIEAGDGRDEIAAAIAGSIRGLAAGDRGGIDLISAPPEAIDVPKDLSAAAGSGGMAAAIGTLISRLFSDIPYRVQGSWFERIEGCPTLELTISRGWHLVDSQSFDALDYGFDSEPVGAVRAKPTPSSVLAAVAAPWLLDAIQYEYHFDRLTLYDINDVDSVARETAGKLWHETDPEIARSLYAEALVIDERNLAARFNLARTHMDRNRNSEALALLFDGLMSPPSDGPAQ